MFGAINYDVAVGPKGFQGQTVHCVHGTTVLYFTKCTCTVLYATLLGVFLLLTELTGTRIVP